MNNGLVTSVLVAAMIYFTAATLSAEGVVWSRVATQATLVPAKLTSGATTEPERAVREFIRALAMHDAEAFGQAVRPDTRARRFLNPQPLTAEGKAEAARRLETLQVRRSDDVLLRGEPVEADGRGDYPVGSVGHFIASGNGGPALVTVVREKDGWKIDLRWWLAMLDMADARPPAAGSPDHAIRNLILALIALDRNEASRFVVPGAEMSVLFDGAPSVREPSGVLESAAMEMPLVEVGAGEFYSMPSGRIVEGKQLALNSRARDLGDRLHQDVQLRWLDEHVRRDANALHADRRAIDRVRPDLVLIE